MKTKISMKTIYLILVIAMGLVGLGVGSTFAVFTAGAEINDPISFSSNLTYDDNVLDVVNIAIEPYSYEKVTFNVKNDNKLDGINYVLWYICEEDDNDIIFTLDDSSKPLDGVLNVSDETINIVINVANGTANVVNINMGVAMSRYDIVLPSYMNLVSNKVVTNLYFLRVEKNINVDTIYCKNNENGNYVAFSSSTALIPFKKDETVYCYGVPVIGYKMDSCTRTEPCSFTINENISTKLTASATDAET